jgi:mannose-6-phosphate isomerase-like protein (cupin superfamily)
VSDEEEYGGDPPCWAHLFDEEGKDGEEPIVTTPGSGAETAGVVDFVAVARKAAAQGAIWTRQSEDLNVNLLVFGAGEGVAEHVNTEVDVLLVGIAGAGTVAVDGKREMIRAGQSLVIPKGATCGTQSMSDRFAYLTCHRRRGGLWPGR